MSAPERLYRNLTLGFSVVIIGFGVVILAVTLASVSLSSRLTRS